jgi:hypothetical protein
MVKGGMIGVKIVGLVGKRMEGGWGWYWSNAGGGYIEVMGGRLHTNLAESPAKGDVLE